jgi:hypothetical protein
MNQVDNSLSPRDEKFLEFDKAMRRLIEIAVVALVTAVIWQEIRISKIEENRFTSTDGAHLERRLIDWADARFPQEWLRNSLTELKTLAKANATSLSEMSNRLTRLEAEK